MKQISLIKRSPFADNYLVNIYHSLYSTALRNTLREKGLFLYVDYNYEYKVYEHKLIWVTITLLSNKAKQIKQDLKSIYPDFSESAVSTSIKSLSANTQQTYSYDFSETKRALEELHKQPWEDYNSLKIIDMQALKLERTHFIRANETFTAKQYVTGFRLDPEYHTTNPHSVLIFAHALDLIIVQCASILSTALGGSLMQTKNINTRDQALLTRTHYFTEKLELKALGEVIGNSYTELIKNGILESIVEYTKQDFRTFPSRAVIPQKVYENTYYIVGYKGWRHLVTQENIIEVLNKTEIRVSDLNRELALPLTTLHKEQGILQA